MVEEAESKQSMPEPKDILARIKHIRQHADNRDSQASNAETAPTPRQQPLPVGNRLAAFSHHISQLPEDTMLLLGIALVLLASEQLRHQWAEFAAAACVVSGFIAAPILTIVAWIGLLVPEKLPLHHATTPLIVIAILWLALAFMSAHLHHSHTGK